MMKSLYCFLVLAVVVGAIADPISSGDRQAVGEALSKALAVMSGNAKSGSKFAICMNMFPDGPPADAATDASWQSCKSVLPSGQRARALLISSNRIPLTAAVREEIVGSLTKVMPKMEKQGAALVSQAVNVLRQEHPLSASEKAAVGDALTKALSTLEHHAGGDMDSICGGMFPNGRRDADTKETDATWVACKDKLYTPKAALVNMHTDLSSSDREVIADGNKAVNLLRQRDPLSSSEKAAVGEALTKALGALEHHSGSGDMYSICDGMFPNGRRDAGTKVTDSTWVACKDKLALPKSAFVGMRALVSKAVAVIRQEEPLSASEKAAVGDALATALGAIENHSGGDIYSMCAGMFPHGHRDANTKATDPTWVACKDKV